MQGRPYAVVDLFAGPGGLAEGFSRVRNARGEAAFDIRLSVEKDAAAHRTLRLRAFLRQFGDDYPREYYDFLASPGAEPDWERLYPAQFRAACEEARMLELGSAEGDREVSRRISAIRREFRGRTLLIGGPPCQAYSLAGRSRNMGKADYVPEEDHRHFLYRSYIKVLTELKPAAFVMENVKGMLSSKVGGGRIFESVMRDLQDCGYRLVAFCQSGFLSLDPAPSDFLIRAEEFGIPQRRHRVIVMGLRKDAGDRCRDLAGLGMEDQRLPEATARMVLDGMPKLRSGLSRGPDDAAAWAAAMTEAVQACSGATIEPRNLAAALRSRFREIGGKLEAGDFPKSRTSARLPKSMARSNTRLAAWLSDPRLRALSNHETRGHMRSDLARYLFASLFAEHESRSPRASEYPPELAPDHRNWQSGNFADRFSVQCRDSASSTITSHISKDGHYYIHPDPEQCRSLTVREAARLQTFPDNYHFLGNRTEQYVQVGNAVPPLLANLIGKRVCALLEACEQTAGDRRSAAA
ncbi:DNA cytosine methyltransferase [Hyphomonas sp.]|uniref:DNA cytosine methyltransferase n=1 Tax=Hyphomonas sp. TaxID=87 RepID=UPI003918A5D2